MDLFLLGIYYFPMAKYEQRLKAREMRKNGIAINRIAIILAVSKGSVSKWCEDISLTSEQISALHESNVRGGYRGRLLGAYSNKQKKLKVLKDSKGWAAHILGNVSRRDLLISGISLYWAEGSKKGSSSGFVFVNSDPSMIRLINVWLKEIFNVKKEELRPSVSINEIHRERIGRVIKFWADLLELPVSQFSSTSFIKSKQQKIYENYENYYGILRLRVSKGSNLKYKVLALIEALSNVGVAQPVVASDS
jgi:hypothetical protein